MKFSNKPKLLAPHSSNRVNNLPRIVLVIFIKLLIPTSGNATQGIGGHNRFTPYRSKYKSRFGEKEGSTTTETESKDR
jgi:hypothetical protein